MAVNTYTQVLQNSQDSEGAAAGAVRALARIAFELEGRMLDPEPSCRSVLRMDP